MTAPRGRRGGLTGSEVKLHLYGSGEADVTGAQDYASLIVQGKDRPGIVAAVTAVLAGFGANIVSLDQYSDDPQGGAFFQRTVFGLEHLSALLPEVEEKLGETLAAGF